MLTAKKVAQVTEIPDEKQRRQAQSDWQFQRSFRTCGRSWRMGMSWAWRAHGYVLSREQRGPGFNPLTSNLLLPGANANRGPVAAGTYRSGSLGLSPAARARSVAPGDSQR